MKDARTLNRAWPALMVAAVALVVFAIAADAQPVVVSTSVSGNAVPGGTVSVRATIDIMDGSTLQSVAWTQVGGATAQINNADRANATVVLGMLRAYRAHLHDILHEPPITAAQLPPNVPVPPEEFPGGQQDRFEVVGVDPFALEEAGLVTLRVEATTTSGTYRATVEIHAPLPWTPSAGIRSVPINVPVLLHAKHAAQGSVDWQLSPPAASNATLIGGNTLLAEFTPDRPGIYDLTVTDPDSSEMVDLRIYAGYWRGVIVAQDANGRPVADAICTGCHNGDLIPDTFTPWSKTGHAEIFTDNLNTSTHYSESCFSCHTVGFNPGYMSGGVDEAPDYLGFLNAGLLNNPGNNWTMVLNQFPRTAQLANIQCENCHGPANSDRGFDTLAHGWIPGVEGEPRVSLGGEVCGQCHGEPLRHGRFQQWQLSAHANYELAIDEGESGNCSRCHTVNGFLTWLPVLLGDEPGDPTADITVTWTAEDAHPQTCVTCHDPHNIGTTTGIDTNATVRISGHTPPLIAGFQVYGAGRGAICMTCHNSRRGLHNDDVYPTDIAGTSETSRAPHGSSQTDVIMGENAYLVNVGVRGRHSLVEDSCVVCHMEATPPPDVLSYQLGGTNHTFFASPDVCQECHEGLTADGIQEAVEAILNHLKTGIEGRIRTLMAGQFSMGYPIDVGSGVMVTANSQIQRVELSESRGRIAIITTLNDGTVAGPTALNSVDVVRPAPLGTVALWDLASEGLIKASWNYTLIHNDGSRGAHNPSWVLEVLDASRDAINLQGGPRSTPAWDLIRRVRMEAGS